ncbi:WD40 repeat-containing protein [Heterostelium album PN500]|uniref:Ribosome biogenesis protein WDR12 homolog n=1 Tax=Heterostelium pallidum (strain ATCC 26659 / Pp 5 / PN500) TaxID=670386 RepID=D3AW79_HETP5|nr:WD40 repeat-containing protein [Heterostelium album PN500]EFA86552.1 WD40 repeat-containing protein [Heterostelium album PN500]|eukprot:XP_020438657.1 WD40 repeat-containing protein [Heterostelium album PN500]
MTVIGYNLVRQSNSHHKDSYSPQTDELSYNIIGNNARFVLLVLIMDNNQVVVKEEGKVKVRFVTNDPNIRVTEIAFGVPERIGRLGLSELVNHLRSEEDTTQHKPFDFLINGQFIRTTLDKHIKKAGLKEEDTITIEYVEAVTEPKREQENQHDDWIASVDGGSLVGLALTGGYDFGARIVDCSANTLITAVGHQAAIKSVAWTKAAKRSHLAFLTASLDQTIRYWHADADAKTVQPMCIFKAHQGSVESVASNPDGTRFASGGYDNKLRLWDLQNLPQPQPQQQPNKKSRKNGAIASSTNILEPSIITESLSTLEKHSQPITTIDWPTQFQLISGGMDKSIRLWDLETMSDTQTMMASTALHVVSYSIDSGLIASGHADHTIRLWDPRIRDGKFNIGSLLSHKNWVTSISWKPGSSTQLLSASHDGTVKLWDTRSKVPLFTIEKHTDKVLSCDWLSNPTDSSNPYIISGGADTKLKIYNN